MIDIKDLIACNLREENNLKYSCPNQWTEYLLNKYAKIGLLMNLKFRNAGSGE
jgi:hypothetical protein